MTTPRPVPTPAPPTKVPLLLVFGCVLLLPINALVIVVTNPPEEWGPYFVGVILGALTVQVLFVLIVWGVARLIGRAKTWRGFFTVAFPTLGITFVLQLAGAVGKAAVMTQTVTDEERAGLDVGADSIRHAGFGFVLPSPGAGFAADSELQQLIDREYAGQRGIVAWGVRDPDRSALVLIQVTKGIQLGEVGFQAFARGVKNGATASGDATFIADTLSWQNGTGEYQLTFAHANGVFTTMRCLGGRHNAVPRVVCVQTSTLERDGLRSVRDGFILR